jgi:hypothetical protein
MLSSKTNPLSRSPSTKAMLAAAKRSKGAPLSICCASWPVEPKTSVTGCPVCASYCSAISVKANCKSAAAATVSGAGAAGINAGWAVQPVANPNRAARVSTHPNCAPCADLLGVTVREIRNPIFRIP